MEALGLTAHLEAFAEAIGEAVAIPADQLKPLLSSAGVSAVNTVRVRSKLTAPPPASGWVGLPMCAVFVFIDCWRLHRPLRKPRHPAPTSAALQ